MDLWNMQLWACAACGSNIDCKQKLQSIALRTITAAYRFETYDDVHRDMKYPMAIDEIITRFIHKSKKKN